MSKYWKQLKKFMFRYVAFYIILYSQCLTKEKDFKVKKYIKDSFSLK